MRITENKTQEEKMKRLVIGMTAHVDSGKTTLSEAMLYRSGEIRRLGRVDHGDAFLDTHSIERSRGITVFSKQAVMSYDGNEITLLDTPGHVDFSAETERALRALDYAVLVISGIDGVQSHTETLWELLRRYKIPVFVFINKMDISSFDRTYLLNELRARLDGRITDFSFTENRDELCDSLALCSEKLMETFLEDGDIPDSQIADAIAQREVFPCCFGSALKLSGVDELLSALGRFTVMPRYSENFGARVYKITTENGVRLTHMKITGGSLRVKSALSCGMDNDASPEKINQIRIYSGVKYNAVDEAFPGTLCAVTGLTRSFAGEGIGAEKNSAPPVLEPVLSYRVILPAGTDVHTVLAQLRQLEEEEPQLHVVWHEQLQEINVQLMGEIQLEILRTLISERFALEVQFDEGRIAYKETIAEAVEGVGHYEPLRHYAEVHLLMEPGEPGSGLVFAADCSEDRLDRNWQRLVLTHLEEKTHLGVLTGSPITDMRITLIAGRAHLKHTEGGDFRQATYRAVRMGLRSTSSILLEPWYEFRLELPGECVGRALSDLQRMDAEFSPPEMTAEAAVITGSAPVSAIRGYHTDVVGYSHGKGRLSCMPKGYYPCRNAEQIIEQIGYDCDADTENSADSVFCSHGAGVIVKWDEVRSRMHVDSGFHLKTTEQPEEPESVRMPSQSSRITASDDELMEIFERTYGKIKRPEREAMHTKREAPPVKNHKPLKLPKGPGYLLVDGYNIIFAWDELKRAAKDNLDLARNMLINTLCNYQGYRQCEVILVFDAYKVPGKHREVEKVHNITVVYTKEAETADMYIEKTAHKLGKDHRVRVATSDGLEQIIILGSNAYRVSAEELHSEVKDVEREIQEYVKK